MLSKSRKRASKSSENCSEENRCSVGNPSYVTKEIALLFRMSLTTAARLWWTGIGLSLIGAAASLLLVSQVSSRVLDTRTSLGPWFIVKFGSTTTNFRPSSRIARGLSFCNLRQGRTLAFNARLIFLCLSFYTSQRPLWYSIRTYAVRCNSRRKRGLRPKCMTYTLREQTNEATKKCADSGGPVTKKLTASFE